MKHESITKKLTKAGFEIHKVENRTGMYYATKEGNPYVISWSWNGGHSDDCVCLNTRVEWDRDELQSDYHAGTYADSIRMALSFAATWYKDGVSYYDPELVKFYGGTWLQDKIDAEEVTAMG